MKRKAIISFIFFGFCLYRISRSKAILASLQTLHQTQLNAGDFYSAGGKSTVDDNDVSEHQRENHGEKLLIRTSMTNSLERPLQIPSKIEREKYEEIIAGSLKKQNTSASTSKKLASGNDEQTNVTMALIYPPGLLGGYRNQVIRFFGFVVGAKEQRVWRLLYPSILWTTVTQGGIKMPIPMEDIFDIDHWNSFFKYLPRLVGNIGSGDCWSATATHEKNITQHHPNAPLLRSVLQKPRFLTPLINVSVAFASGQLQINPRRYDVTPQVQHCNHPRAYGGGAGRGRLWIDYMNYNRRRRKHPRTGHYEPDDLEGWFLRALRPVPKWIQLAQQCIQRGTKQEQVRPTLQYIALHPRVELEMMSHNCGQYMNRNLTSIFEDIRAFLSNTTASFPYLSGIFVAVSRAGASRFPAKYSRLVQNIRENVAAMDRVIGNASSPGEGLFVSERNLPVFECGDELLKHYYQPTQSMDYGSLLPSVINFHVAVEATAFIGMRFSSWSNSVWATRFYLGKGDTNFEYTRTRGIQPIENGGYPPPHQNCDSIKDPGR